MYFNTCYTFMKIRYYKNILQYLDFEILHILSTLKIKIVQYGTFGECYKLTAMFLFMSVINAILWLKTFIQTRFSIYILLSLENSICLKWKRPKHGPKGWTSKSTLADGLISTCQSPSYPKRFLYYHGKMLVPTECLIPNF